MTLSETGTSVLGNIKTALTFAAHVLFLICYFIGDLIWKILTCCIPTRKKGLAGEIILVTGGGSGIGKEVCRQLALLEKDLTIISWDVNEPGNLNTVNELKQLGVKGAYAFTVDVGDEREVANAARKIRQEIGDVTILFNNAGISGEVKEGWKQSPESIEQVFRVNLFAHCWTLREFLPNMIKMGRGNIVETCSLLGFIYGPFASSYVASKFAVRGYIECVKEDVRRLAKDSDIHFSLVYPHLTKTNMTASLLLSSRKYPFLIPERSAKSVAARMILGMRKNEENIYIPYYLKILEMGLALMPRNVIRKLIDMVDIEDPLSRYDAVKNGQLATNV